MKESFMIGVLTTNDIWAAQQNNITPEEQFEYEKRKDEFKRNYALEHGYFYLEIPYWTDDRAETYKTLINNKINEIQSNILIA